MDKTLRKIRDSVTMIILAIILLSTLSIYIPMKNELAGSTQHNFVLMHETYHLALEKTIAENLDEAKDLSNDDILKEAAIEYRKGVISLTELENNTAQKYDSSLRQESGAAGAFRIIDGNVIDSWGNVDLSKMEKAKEISGTTTEVSKSSQNSTVLIVYSPIKSGSSILGFDVSFFNLSGVLNDVHDNVMQHQVCTKEEVEQIRSNKRRIVFDNGLQLITDRQNSWYIQSIEPINMYFVASISNKELYKTQNNILLVMFVAFIAIIIIIAFAIHFISIKYFKDIIDKLEQRKDMYKEFASKDWLTGTYSRMYFNQYVEKHSDGLKEDDLAMMIVMIDVNKFKLINDTYGHLAGDAVLKKIADIIKNSIRYGDIVVRYGGDEFLLLLENCNIEISKSIMSRISEQLTGIHEFDFPIEVSYGMAELKEWNKFIQTVKEADKKMYHMKNGRFDETAMGMGQL